MVQRNSRRGKSSWTVSCGRCKRLTFSPPPFVTRQPSGRLFAKERVVIIMSETVSQTQRSKTFLSSIRRLVSEGSQAGAKGPESLLIGRGNWLLTPSLRVSKRLRPVAAQQRPRPLVHESGPASRSASYQRPCKRSSQARKKSPPPLIRNQVQKILSLFPDA